MTSLPSIRHLEYLVALDEHAHFGRAAAACDASQSSFSAGISELELHLRVRIAERNRRRVTMTSVGRRLALQARRVLAEAQAMLALAESEAGPMSGEVQLGSIPTIAPYVLPRLLPAMRQRFPHLDLLLREDKTPELLQQLADGRLDLLLMAFPYATPGCETLMLLRDPYLYACGGDGPLAGHASISARDIQSQPLMLLEPGHCLHSHALPVLQTAAKAHGTTFSATSLQTLVAMVAVGIGTTLLPRLAVDAGLVTGSGVITRPLGYAGGERRIGLCWRQGSARAADYRRLGEAIREWATQNHVAEPLPEAAAVR